MSETPNPVNVLRHSVNLSGISSPVDEGAFQIYEDFCAGREPAKITMIRVRWWNTKKNKARTTKVPVGDQGGPISAVYTIEAMGCTSYAQARRLAEWIAAHGPSVDLGPGL